MENVTDGGPPYVPDYTLRTDLMPGPNEVARNQLYRYTLIHRPPTLPGTEYSRRVQGISRFFPNRTLRTGQTRVRLNTSRVTVRRRARVARFPIGKRNV